MLRKYAAQGNAESFIGRARAITLAHNHFNSSDLLWSYLVKHHFFHFLKSLEGFNRSLLMALSFMSSPHDFSMDRICFFQKPGILLIIIDA